MAATNFDDVFMDIKQKKYHPIYWFEGNEAFFIDELVNYMVSHVLDESERDFNQDVVYGRDVNPAQLVEMARQYPLMSERRLVVVKEAQNLESNKLDQLEAYFEKPSETTILVFAYKGKTLDKRKKIAKLIDKSGILFESKQLWDNQISGWVKQYVAQMNFDITPKAAQMIADYLGTNLSKIANELGKLKLNLQPGHKINDLDIETHIGISKDFNPFEYIKAIAARDVAKANTIALHFGQNDKNNPLAMTLALLYNFWSKVMALHFEKSSNREDLARKMGFRNAYAASDYFLAKQNYPATKIFENISLLREFDLRYKGVESGNIGDGDLYKELTYRMMH